MQQTEPLSEQSKRKISPLLLTVGGILGVSALLLAMPSSRGSREAKAKAKLANEFAGPKDLNYLNKGQFVSDKGFTSIGAPGDGVKINVFAPKPTDVVPPDFFDGIRAYRYSGWVESSGWTCLLAPDPSSVGWTLFAKVWIAEAIQKHPKLMQDMDTKARNVSIGNPATMTELKAMWAKTPASVQTQAETILAQNREAVKSLPGVHRYYKTRNGDNYEIGPKNSIWEFDQALEDSHVNQKKAGK